MYQIKHYHVEEEIPSCFICFSLGETTPWRTVLSRLTSVGRSNSTETSRCQLREEYGQVGTKSYLYAKIVEVEELAPNFNVPKNVLENKKPKYGPLKIRNTRLWKQRMLLIICHGNNVSGVVAKMESDKKNNPPTT